ncbi:hypothetical protein BDZ91DRAFT_793497 [Kalaharituber pfeilii]|nr:hypothetical protein BDZ91DRAFT_793497 [Kalaharituber pfeilii]
MHKLLYEIVMAKRVDPGDEYALTHQHLKYIQLFTSHIHKKYFGNEELDSAETKKSTPPTRNVDTQTEGPSYAEAATETSTAPPRKMRSAPPAPSSVKKRDPPASAKGKTTTSRATSTAKSKPPTKKSQNYNLPVQQ